MILKSLYWDLKNSNSRKDYIYSLVRNFPGTTGFLLREKVLRKRFKVAKENTRIHLGVKIINIQKLELGKHVHLGVDSYIQAGGGITIGDYTELGPGAKIWSQTHLFDDPDKNLENAGYEYKEVKIGHNVWIGANAFIMPGAIIEDGCVIAACSVVSGKLWPKNSIISGNPARKIGERGNFRTQNQTK